MRNAECGLKQPALINPESAIPPGPLTVGLPQSRKIENLDNKS